MLRFNNNNNNNNNNDFENNNNDFEYAVWLPLRVFEQPRSIRSLAYVHRHRLV